VFDLDKRVWIVLNNKERVPLVHDDGETTVLLMFSSPDKARTFADDYGLGPHEYDLTNHTIAEVMMIVEVWPHQLFGALDVDYHHEGTIATVFLGGKKGANANG
jgi:hypothetical protein